MPLQPVTTLILIERCVNAWMHVLFAPILKFESSSADVRRGGSLVESPLVDFGGMTMSSKEWSITQSFFFLSLLLGCAPGRIGNEALVYKSVEQGPELLGAGHPAYGNLVALVERRPDAGELRGAYCSGNFYHNNTVITAAHCVLKKFSQRDLGLKTDFSVFFGTDLSSGGQHLAVEEIAVHPKADLAVLKLQTAAPESYKPLPILPDLKMVEKGGSLSIAGFGSTYENNAGANLQARQGSSTLAKVSDTQIVTTYAGLSEKYNHGVPSSDLETICDGDSGSALIASFANGSFSVAVVARNLGVFGQFCGEIAAAYTPLPPLRMWINQEVERMTGRKVPQDVLPTAASGAGENEDRPEQEANERTAGVAPAELVPVAEVPTVAQTKLCSLSALKECAGPLGRGGAGCVPRSCQGGSHFSSQAAVTCQVALLEECLLTTGHDGGTSCLTEPYRGTLVCGSARTEPLW
jgi:hypothetical protein